MNFAKVSGVAVCTVTRTALAADCDVVTKRDCGWTAELAL